MEVVNYQEKLEKLLQIDISTIKTEVNLINHYTAIADCYYRLKDYKNETIYREKLTKLKPTATDWNNLAVSLENQKINKNVLLYYKKAIALGTTNSIIFSNVIRYIIKKKLWATAKSLRPAPQNYSGNLSFIIKFADACVDNNEIEAFALTNNLIITESCGDYSENFIVKKIFDITEKLGNKNDIRALLLSLYANIAEIKKKLKYSIKIDKGEVCHYTKIENLKNLIQKEKDTMLHLYNVQYMNDPSEGNVFYDLVEAAIKKSIFNGKEQKGRKHINDSNTYLGSFSKNLDSLPLWVQYGNDGMGCCLVFKNDFFDANEPVTDPKMYGLTISNGEKEQTEIVAEKYVLYKVEYVENISECKYYTQLKSIGEIMLKLREQGNSNEEDNEIFSTAMNILDQVRFLFKGNDYSHEMELRVIKWSNSPKCDEGNRSREIPHLYVEMEKTLKLKEIILGPKVIKPSEISPFLYYSGKVDLVTKSTIKYQ